MTKKSNMKKFLFVKISQQGTLLRRNKGRKRESITKKYPKKKTVQKSPHRKTLLWFFCSTKHFLQFCSNFLTKKIIFPLFIFFHFFLNFWEKFSVFFVVEFFFSSWRQTKASVFFVLLHSRSRWIYSFESNWPMSSQCRHDRCWLTDFCCCLLPKREIFCVWTNLMLFSGKRDINYLVYP